MTTGEETYLTCIPCRNGKVEVESFREDEVGAPGFGMAARGERPPTRWYAVGICPGCGREIRERAEAHPR